MHLRRALLLFALVLGLTALATSIVPAPHSSRPARPAPAPPAPSAGAATGQPLAPPGVPTLAFAAPARKGRSLARSARAGAHVVIAVSASSPGDAAIPALGRTVSAQPGTPATFDVLVPAPGRYAIVFTPASGAGARVVGTLLSRP